MKKSINLTTTNKAKRRLKPSVKIVLAVILIIGTLTATPKIVANAKSLKSAIMEQQHHIFESLAQHELRERYRTEYRMPSVLIVEGLSYNLLAEGNAELYTMKLYDGNNHIRYTVEVPYTLFHEYRKAKEQNDFLGEGDEGDATLARLYISPVKKSNANDMDFMVHVDPETGKHTPLAIIELHDVK